MLLTKTTTTKTTKTNTTRAFSRQPFSTLFNVSLLSLSLLATTAQANISPVYYDEVTLNKQAKENEFIGVSTGLIAGAILGGPIGAVVASISGAAIADSVNESQKSEVLISALEEQRIAYTNLQQQYDSMLAATWEANERAQVQAVALQDSMPQAQDQWQLSNTVLPVESQIQFTSGSAVLQQHYVQGLTALAEHLTARQDLKIQLHGYADRRGENDANLWLSEQRVNSVAAFLLNNGVSSSQIDLHFYGEAQPVNAEQSLENDFFDRRVVLKVHSADGMMTAAK